MLNIADPAGSRRLGDGWPEFEPLTRRLTRRKARANAPAAPDLAPLQVKAEFGQLLVHHCRFYRHEVAA
jgi:hypothetical protein